MSEDFGSRVRVAAACLALCAASCSTPQKIGAAAVAVGGMTPGQEIEQVYYLGVVDPQEQLPTSLYRVHVRGQASLVSKTKFASGWVPANAVDSLTVTPAFGAGGGVVIDDSGQREALMEVELAKRALGAATTEREAVASAVAALRKSAEELGNQARALEPQGEEPLTPLGVLTTAVKTATQSAVRAKTQPLVTALKTEAGKVLDPQLGAGLHGELVATKPLPDETAFRQRFQTIGWSVTAGGGPVKTYLDATLAALKGDAAKAISKSIAEAVARDVTLAEQEKARYAASIDDVVKDVVTQEMRTQAIESAKQASQDAWTNAKLGVPAAWHADLTSGKVLHDAVGASVAAALDALAAGAATDLVAAVRTDLSALGGDVSSWNRVLELRRQAAEKTAAADAKSKEQSPKDVQVAQASARLGVAEAVLASTGRGDGFTIGRRLVLFGPEGFRESPANHRLVILMGTSPEDFFQAASGAITRAERVAAGEESTRIWTLMTQALRSVREASARLAEVERRTGELAKQPEKSP